MFTRTCSTIALALALSGFSHSVSAASLKISGGVDAAYTKKDMAPLVDEAHPVIIGTASKGVNKGSGPFDGLAYNNMEVEILTQGTGRQEGFVTFTNGTDATIAKIAGDIMTVVKDSKPSTTFHGKWRYVEGVGKFKGIKGEGDYSGALSASQDGYHVDWRGHAVLPASVATR